MEKNLLDLSVVDYWMEEANALGFKMMRCDEFAAWIMDLYYGTAAEEVATLYAHLLWPQGHEMLYNWQVYAMWSYLEKLSEEEAAL